MRDFETPTAMLIFQALSIRKELQIFHFLRYLSP
jgi:hypothetical protein